MSYQVIIGFDVSMSMQSAHNGSTRLAVAKELAGGIIDVACQMDPDGPELFTFGQGVKSRGTVTVAEAKAVLAGITATDPRNDTGAFLTEAFKLARKKNADGDQALIIVITDGDASDRDVVERQIVSMTKDMTEDGQCAVEFISVGNAADAWLTRLDDDLKAAAFDIVDATPIEEAVKLGIEGLYNKAFSD